MMKCTACSGLLEIQRRCGSVKMCCSTCGKTYAIHEVSDQLDTRTEKILERYSTIIYD